MTVKVPKSSQFHFFLMPDEIKLFLSFIADQQCAVYPSRLNSLEPHEFDMTNDISQMFFCPREISHQIKTYRIKDEIFTIDRTTSPVIEFDPSYLSTNGLSQGRLFFHGGYDGREQWVAYPESLYLVYKRAISFMKKAFLTKDRECLGYVSKGSQQYVSKGGSLKQ